MNKIVLNDIYKISEDVVARQIEDEFFIIPVTSKIGDSADDMYSLNESGLEIWNLIDGTRSVGEIVKELSSKFEAEEDEIREDVEGLLNELIKRYILEKA